MSKMTIANKKLMLAGLYLSKFNREGLASLGFRTLGEAYKSFAFAFGGKPTSVKLYMQEFDPYFPNSRIGFKNKAIRPRRQAFINEYVGAQRYGKNCRICAGNQIHIHPLLPSSTKMRPSPMGEGNVSLPFPPLHLPSPWEPFNTTIRIPLPRNK